MPAASFVTFRKKGPTTRKMFSYSLTVYILLDMAGGHGKRALSAEELERQRKQREDEALEDLQRRMIQEDDGDIPEHVYRYHVQVNLIDDVVLPQNIPGIEINIYDRYSLDPSHFMMFLDEDGNPRADPGQEDQSGQQQEEQYHRLGEDHEGDQHDDDEDDEEELVIPQPRIKLRRGSREKSGSGQTVRVRSKYF